MNEWVDFYLRILILIEWMNGWFLFTDFDFNWMNGWFLFADFDFNWMNEWLIFICGFSKCGLSFTSFQKFLK